MTSGVTAEGNGGRCFVSLGGDTGMELGEDDNAVGDVLLELFLSYRCFARG